MTESGSRVSLPPHPVGVLISLSRDRHRPGGPGERDGLNWWETTEDEVEAFQFWRPATCSATPCSRSTTATA
jgi:hypothetical protein